MKRSDLEVQLREALAQLIEHEREAGARSLYEFVKMAWHLVEPSTEFSDNWHIRLICDHLEALFERRIKRLIINVPPSCMKSLLCSVFFPAWCWIKAPDMRSVNVSFDGALTARDGAKVCAIIQSDWFKQRWGDKFKIPKTLPKTEFMNEKMGLRFSTSIGGKVTGWHFDLLGIDDPIKPKNVTDVGLQAVKNWWGGTFASRFRDPKTGLKLIVMQRLHYNDLVGHCLSDKETQWVHLRLPMRYEAAFPCETPIGKDPRTIDGELLWPDRHTEETLRELAKELGPMGVAAQLQQRPTPEGGAIFRSDWFQFYETLPTSFDELLQSWDCTFKGEKKSDWVVGQVWGRKGEKYYLLDQYRAQASFTETVRAVRSMARKWPKCRVILIEDKANGTAVIEALRKGLTESKEIEARLSNVVPIEPDGGKEARAHACTGLFEAGSVFHPTAERADWVVHHQAELVTFPLGANDDTVDATTQALNYMRQNQNYIESAMQKLLSGG